VNLGTELLKNFGTRMRILQLNGIVAVVVLDRWTLVLAVSVKLYPDTVGICVMINVLAY
jgi:hypothetical protein